ncbi:MAG: acetylxylan esterase [Hyphomicrobiales bacterium]|nr:acetylxylan esterase [Hyphomicrobiales bacterium]
MTVHFAHSYPFDPSYGMDLAALLAVEPPTPPDGFAEFWRARRDRARAVDPAPRLSNPRRVGDHVLFDCAHRSTDGVEIRGWHLRPAEGPPTRGLVVGHGYGGRDAPDFDLALPGTALLFPCSRGLGRSTVPGLSSDPYVHVLSGIEDRDRYVLGGCVEDAWTSVSALLALAPEVEGRIGWSGISFGGGVGALMLPWEERVDRAELLLPTFGHQALRLGLPMVGSGAAIAEWEKRHGGVMETLQWFDAASAARFVTQPVIAGLALFDPAVPPPGQFAIFNALPKTKDLVTFDAGHFDYPGAAAQEEVRLRRARDFFKALLPGAA